MPTKIGYVLQAYEFDDQSKEAEELFVKAVRWWPEFEGSFFMNRAFGKMHRADFEGVATLLRRARKDVLSPYAAGLIDVVAVASAKSIGASSACGSDVKPFIAAHCAIVLAWLGDHDRAFAFADRAYPKRIGSTPAETERIWLNQPDSMPTSWLSTPAAAPLRRDPRFLALAQRLGLLAYWRTGRLPDFCRKQREPICARLSRA